MRRLTLLPLLLPVAFAGLVHAADNWRTFTDTDGRKMVAKVLSVEDSFVIVEIKSNGRQMPIDFERLSKDDVIYLRQLRSSPASRRQAGEGQSNEGEDGDLPQGEPENSRLYPRTREEIRSGIREIGDRARPDGIGKAEHQATIRLNIYRFLCGVPHEVAADPGFCEHAREAALACRGAGQISHSLGNYTDKCNLSTLGNVVDCVTQFITDSGENNRDARGHRAWCLNARMGKVGFGSGGDGYSAMWCMDTSGKAVRDTWSYPGKGLFPVEYVHGNAWSLYGAGNPGSADKLKVEVYRLARRPDRAFAAHEEIPGRALEIRHVSLGMNAINFEPEEPNRRGIYWVRVNGGGVREGYLVELF